MLLRDLIFAGRQLRRAPGYSLAVVLTLTLAIGANTAVFSLYEGFLLRRLPYPEPERIGSVITHKQGISRTTGRSVEEDDDSHDLAEWRAIKESTPALVTATSSGGADGVNFSVGNNAGYVPASRVSAGYFDVLGIRPLLGRGFTAEEDTAGGPEAAVISYTLWQHSFDGDPAILGKPVLIKGEPYTIVGVLPPGVQTPGGAQLWVPHRATDPKGECAGGDNCSILVRLRPGATWAEARTQLRSIEMPMFAGMRKAHGDGWFTVRPLQEELAVREGMSLAAPVHGLMLAVFSVLLIAAANLAGLSLVRVTRRTPEMATRLALGASRGTLVLQLWLESVVLAAAGAALGIGLAALLLRGAVRVLPLWMQPMGGLSLDLGVLLFAVAVSVGASLFFGLLPALQLRRVDVRSVLAAGGRGGTFRRGAMRQWLIGGEVALTVVLLAAAGLLIRTLIHLQTLPPGFDATDVMTAKASLDDARYRDAGKFQSLMSKSVAAMRAIPGVEDASVGLSLPYERGLNDGLRINDGPQAGAREGSSVVWTTPGYFATLRIPLLTGRTFTDSDTADAEKVAIVNSSFARRYFGTDRPLGYHFDGRRIVGVVSDVAKAPGMRRDAPLSTEPVYYLPVAQTPQELVNMASVWFQPSWIVRTRGPIGGITGEMQRALASADSALPFSGFYSMEEIEAEQIELQRVEVMLLSALAGLALLLSGIGIYSLVANLMVERTREVGIRLALGSTVGEAMVTIGSSGMAAGLAGTAMGVFLSLFVLRLMKSQIYGVTALDPVTLVSVPVALLVLCAAASALPVLRVGRIDPADILRAQ